MTWWERLPSPMQTALGRLVNGLVVIALLAGFVAVVHHYKDHGFFNLTSKYAQAGKHPSFSNCAMTACLCVHMLCKRCQISRSIGVFHSGLDVGGSNNNLTSDGPLAIPGLHGPRPGDSSKEGTCAYS